MNAGGASSLSRVHLSRVHLLQVRLPQVLLSQVHLSQLHLSQLHLSQVHLEVGTQANARRQGRTNSRATGNPGRRAP